MPIRSALPSDARAIAVVHIRSWQAAYRDLLPAPYLDALGIGLDERTAAWHDRLSSPGAPTVLLAEGTAGAVEAFSCFRPWSGVELDPSVTAEPATLYAVPEAWGRGVGRALLAATTEAMRAAGFRAAGLWVLEGNVRARAFYEAAGWRPDGVDGVEETGGRMLRELRYRATL